MSRDHARILTAIWSDDDFVALPAAAQRMYLLLLTQPGLTYAGVQDLERLHLVAFCPAERCGYKTNVPVPVSPADDAQVILPLLPSDRRQQRRHR